MYGIAEKYLEQEAGCGLFQILVVVFVLISLRVCASSILIFMSFGNFNPGWRCLDNVTGILNHYINQSRRDIPITHNHYSNQSEIEISQFNRLSGINHVIPTINQTGTENSSLSYITDFRCEEFKSCRRVEFNPDSITVVTEWKLVCDSAWVASLIISLQMAGGLVGSIIAGYIADRFGRKKAIYSALFMNGVLLCVCSFVNSWQVFAVFMLFIGLFSSIFETSIYVYSSEFMTKKWRGPIAGVPGWAIGGLIFGITAMAWMHWRRVLLSVAALCFFSFNAVFWVPESLRWLEVKNKTNELKSGMKTISRLNGKTVEEFTEHNLNQDKHCQILVEDSINTKQYSLIDLFRPGYSSTTLVVGFVWISTSFIYFALIFGVKSLNGDFYVNLLLFYAILVPGALIPIFAPNILGRTKSSCILMFLIAVCLLTSCGVEMFLEGKKHDLITLCLVLAAIVCLESTVSVQQAHTSELYPTVVRGSALSWVVLMARIGSMTAPFIIPKDSGSMVTWYLVTGILACLCCLAISRLPETKGKALKEAFSKERIVSNEKSLNV